MKYLRCHIQSTNETVRACVLFRRTWTRLQRWTLDLKRSFATTTMHWSLSPGDAYPIPNEADWLIVVHALAHQALHLQSLCARRSTDKLGHGPVIVDGAFTKLYCHWNVRSSHCFAEANRCLSPNPLPPLIRLSIMDI